MGIAKTDIPSTRAEWQARADALVFRNRAFIDGQWRAAVSGKEFDAGSPIDGRVLTRVSECEAADVELAVAAARRAFDRGEWSNASPVKRKKTLQKLARLVEKHAVELALLETLDMGKPIDDALGVDVAASIRCLDWTAEAIDKVFDQVAPTGHDELGLITHEPLGVVAAIVPWNFPLLMAAWKVAPALATGNSVLLKPSEKSPLTALRLAELVAEAGIPDGVFNVLPGFGPGCGEAMALHMDIDGLVFTGSTAVGKLLLQCSGRSNMKRAYMECGGKSPNIVFADAPDLRAAATAAAGAIFYNQGEVCTAGSRLLVERSIKDEFLAMVLEAGKGMQPGHPLEPGALMGAMVDRLQMDRVLGYIARGREEGARLAMGGKQVLVDSGGFYIEPTVFDGVAPGMKISREEIFGPVLSAIAAHGEPGTLLAAV